MIFGIRKPLVLAGVILWLSGFIVGMNYMSTMKPHFYGGAPHDSAGVVFWNDGLGFEFRGSPGFFIEDKNDSQSH